MTRIIPIRQGIALRELMCGKHEKPVTREDLIDAAVKAVAARVARNSYLPANTHLAVWLVNRWIIPLASIRAEFGAIR